MINTRLLIFTLTISLSLIACSDNKNPANTSNEFDITKNIGWMHGHCLVIENANLTLGTNIDIVSFGKTQAHLQAKIKAKVKDDVNCVPLLSDRKDVNQTSERSFYIIDISKEHEEIIALGIVKAKPSFKIVKGLVQADINNNGTNESFSSCTGSEGIHFSLTEKQGETIKTLWKSYYYLGYDITPDCPS